MCKPIIESPIVASSELYTTAKLDEEIEDELNRLDPEVKVAHAILKHNEQNEQDDEDF